MKANQRTAPVVPAVPARPAPVTDGEGNGWPPTPPPQPAGAGREGPLEQAWRIVSRHPFLILQAIVLVAAAAFVYSATRETQYTANAAILFEDATEGIGGTGGGFEDPSRAAATNEQLLTLGVIAERTANRLGGRISAPAIAEAVEVVSTPEADIVGVQVTTNDPELSARVANEYARAFEGFRQDSARRQFQQAIAQANQALAALTPTESAGERGEALRERVEQLENALALQSGDAELVQPANPPSAPSAPQPVRNGVLGGLLGTLLGFGLAALRERVDRGVKTVDELEQEYRRPILARVPRSRDLAKARGLVARGEEAESFRMLRSSLRYFSVKQDVRSLLVTSALPAEGKSTVARYLAETMASMGDRVVLVMADMHHPGPLPRAGEDGARGLGLSGVLIGRDLDEALEEVEVPGGMIEARRLAVLPPGPLPPNPSELLETERMREVLRALETRFDVVIVDSPPAAVLSDTLALVGHVSGIIMVSAVGKTTREAIRESLRHISLLGGNLLGVIANFAPPADRAASSYYTQRAS